LLSNKGPEGESLPGFFSAAKTPIKGVGALECFNVDEEHGNTA